MWTLTHTTKKDESGFLDKAHAGLQALKQRKEIGFLQLGKRENLWSSSEVRGRELRKSYHDLAVLGMGGSSLGGRSLMQSLRKWDSAQNVTFIDNVDADFFWKWLRSHKNLQDVHWVIVSKSGNTIETLTMAEFVEQHLRVSGFKKLAATSTVISEPRANPLTNWARKEGVPILEIPQDVGGRFSVLTPVGMLPAAFYGLDVERIRSGVEWAYEQDELIARLAAQSLMSFQREEWISLFWAYADGLRDFGLWTQQLWAESLGKALDRSGAKAPRASTPMSAVGSSDQHSILQQVMEGTRDKFVWFFRVEQSESAGPTLERGLFEGQSLMHGKTMGELLAAEAVATRQALEHQKVQSLTLQTQSLSEESMGALFMIMQLVVGSLGEALGINAFDQPGVELGKVMARDILTKLEK